MPAYAPSPLFLEGKGLLVAVAESSSSGTAQEVVTFQPEVAIVDYALDS